MAKFQTVDSPVEAADWSAFTGTLPLSGATHPQGQARSALAGRMRKAFKAVKARQTA